MPQSTPQVHWNTLFYISGTKYLIPTLVSTAESRKILVAFVSVKKNTKWLIMSPSPTKTNVHSPQKLKTHLFLIHYVPIRKLYSVNLNSWRLIKNCVFFQRATSEELECIKEHVSSKPSVPLDKPEQFLYDLSQISNFAERISCLMFEVEFDNAINSIGYNLTNMKTTCDVSMLSLVINIPSL